MERSFGSRRLILGFDAGCSTCSDLAERIEKAVGDKLEVRSLYDPRMEHWRKQALGEDAPWTPTLVEIKSGKVRAWTGPVMGLALGKRLGPKATWRIMQVLGDRNSSQNTRPRAVEDASSINRGQFLKGLVGALAAMSILPASAFASPGSPSDEARVYGLRSVPSASDAIRRLKRFRAVQRLDERFGKPNWGKVTEARYWTDGHERRSYSIPLRAKENNPAVTTHLVVEDETTLEVTGSVVMRTRNSDDGQIASITWYVPEGRVIGTHGFVDGRLAARSIPVEEANIYRGQVARSSFRRCFLACVGRPLTRFCSRTCVSCVQGAPPGSCAFCAACTGGVGAYCAIRCL